MIIRENHHDNPLAPYVLIGTFVAIALPAAQAGAGAAQSAVAGVAEAANSVINVRWAVMQLGLDLIDYVPNGRCGAVN
jgi:hypothetical protein